MFEVVDRNAAHGFGPPLRRFRALEPERLVAAQGRRAIDGSRLRGEVLYVGPLADDEEGTTLRDATQSSEIEVPAGSSQDNCRAQWERHRATAYPRNFPR